MLQGRSSMYKNELHVMGVLSGSALHVLRGRGVWDPVGYDAATIAFLAHRP
jgi:Fe2+ transport system protein FeoA